MSRALLLLLRRLIGGFRALFRKTRVEQDLDAELGAFLDAAIDRKMRTGLSRADAVRAARMELGSAEAVKDRVRDVGWESIVDTNGRDVRDAIGGLRKSPGFTAVTALTLALGIGATTAIFSVVNSLLLRTLPVADPHRLVTISSAADLMQGRDSPWTYAMWLAIQQRAHAFDGACAWSAVPLNLAQHGQSELVEGLFVSGTFFSTLGVPAYIGRTLSLSDDVRGGGEHGPVAVLSYAYWQRRYGGSPGIIGAPLVVQGVPFTIVGVAPASFFGVEVGKTFDVALPIGTEPLINPRASALDQPGAFWLTVMLRVAPGQSLDSATATLRGVQPQIAEAAIPADAPFGFSRSDFVRNPFALVPAAAGTSILRQQYQRPMLGVLVVAAVVLFIACANLANLLLARAAARRREFSVRIALGAAHGRLVRLLLLESLLLAGAGALAGLVVATWGSRALVAQLSDHASRIFLDLPLDWRVMTFAVVLTLATTVVFGTAPAFRATRVDPIEALKSHGGTVAGTELWSHVVIVQMALALMLVVIGGLFVRTFERLATLPLGFDSDRILVVDVNATDVAPADRLAYYARLGSAVGAVPGVASAAFSMITPVGGGGMIDTIEVPGMGPLPARERAVRLNYLTPGWLATYGTGIRAGRDIDARDESRSAPRVLLVNDAFARRFFPGQQAVGQTIISGTGRSRGPKVVVGLVADAVYDSLREDPQPTVYAPLAHLNTTPGSVRMSVRSSGDSPATLIPDVSSALTAVDGRLRFAFVTLSERVSASLARERLVAALSGVFGALALVLAGVGLYGVTAYAAGRRRSEIGIRMALGAQRGDVISLVLRQLLQMTAIGLALGLAGAAAISRYVEGMLFGITPLDATTFVVVSCAFTAVVVLAAFIPARRATAIDAMTSLRCE